MIEKAEKEKELDVDYLSSIEVLHFNLTFCLGNMFLFDVRV